MALDALRGIWDPNFEEQDALEDEHDLIAELSDQRGVPSVQRGASAHPERERSMAAGAGGGLDIEKHSHYAAGEHVHFNPASKEEKVEDLRSPSYRRNVDVARRILRASEAQPRGGSPRSPGRAPPQPESARGATAAPPPEDIGSPSYRSQVNVARRILHASQAAEQQRATGGGGLFVPEPEHSWKTVADGSFDAGKEPRTWWPSNPVSRSRLFRRLDQDLHDDIGVPQRDTLAGAARDGAESAYGALPVGIGGCCTRCRVLEAHTEALAQSLAGLASLLYRWSLPYAETNKELMGAWKEAVDYLQPCAHLHSLISDAAEELRNAARKTGADESQRSEELRKGFQEALGTTLREDEEAPLSIQQVIRKNNDAFGIIEQGRLHEHWAKEEPLVIAGPGSVAAQENRQLKRQLAELRAENQRLRKKGIPVFELVGDIRTQLDRMGALERAAKMRRDEMSANRNGERTVLEDLQMSIVEKKRKMIELEGVLVEVEQRQAYVQVVQQNVQALETKYGIAVEAFQHLERTQQVSKLQDLLQYQLARSRAQALQRWAIRKRQGEQLPRDITRECVWKNISLNSLRLREMPNFECDFTSWILLPGEEFRVSEERRGFAAAPGTENADMVWLRLANGHGWAYSSLPGMEDLCARLPEGVETLAKAKDQANKLLDVIVWVQWYFQWRISTRLKPDMELTDIVRSLQGVVSSGMQQDEESGRGSEYSDVSSARESDTVVDTEVSSAGPDELPEDRPGDYRITTDALVRKAPDQLSRAQGKVKVGALVQVLEINAEDGFHVFGRVERPVKGWIELKDKETGNVWAVAE